MNEPYKRNKTRTQYIEKVKPKLQKQEDSKDSKEEAKSTASSSNPESIPSNPAEPQIFKAVSGAVYSNGLIARLTPKFVLGPEGSEAFARKFHHLSNAKPDGSGPRFDPSRGYIPHDHSACALGRQLSNERVIAKELRNLERRGVMIDVGGSITRNHAMQLNTIWCQSPLDIDFKDKIRFRNLPKDVLKDMRDNRCDCKGGQYEERCGFCTFSHKITISVDAAYYPGVLQEQMVHSYTSKGYGYVVFNDYHAALKAHGVRGRTCDEESNYLIEGDFVTSFVKGNNAPYKHRFLNTEGLESWYIKHDLVVPEALTKNLKAWDDNNWVEAARQKRKVDTKIVKAITFFEVVDEFINKDVPYRTLKLYTFAEDEIKDDLSMMAEMKTLFYEEGADMQDVDEDIKVSAIRMNKEVVVSKPPSSKIAPNNVSVEMPELNAKDYPKFGTQVYDFINRTQTTTQSNWLELMKNHVLFPKILGGGINNERFSMSHLEGEHYLNLTVYNTRWYSLGLRLKSGTYTAKIDTVYKAFVKLGVKSTLQAIEFQISAMQKELEEETGLAALHVHEAFIIARVLHAQQTRRLQKAMELCDSLSQKK